jgi:hypothetical protein
MCLSCYEQSEHRAERSVARPPDLEASLVQGRRRARRKSPIKVILLSSANSTAPWVGALREISI